MKQSICECEMRESRTIRLRTTTPTKTIDLAVTVQDAPSDWQSERMPREVGDYLKSVGEYIDELLDRGHPSGGVVRKAGTAGEKILCGIAEKSRPQVLGGEDEDEKKPA